jgi:hypothetical protein
MNTCRGALILLSLAALLGSRGGAQALVWSAGPDLAANEASPGTETSNPNATVTAWSYGWRATATGTGLTLFAAGEHSNNHGGYSGLDGFFRSETSGPALLVNTSAVPITINNGAGPLGLLAASEMLLDPSFSGLFTVVRWTAPSSGSYLVAAAWRDIDPYGGDGVSANLVLNGVSIFGASIANAGSGA